MKPTYFFVSRTFTACVAFILTTAAGAQTQAPPTVTPPPAPPTVPARPAPEPYPADEKPDFPGALWEPASPLNFQKFDRATTEHPINCIVIHDIEGPAISAVRWFQNPVAQVSSHYVVGADGTVYQLVKERDVAWHAGNRDVNRRAVGIEHDGFAYRPGFYNPAEYEASARLVRSIALRYQIPRDRTHIFGHAEVPSAAQPGKFGGSGGHTDPGPYWDWDYFMALVRNDAAAVVAAGRPVSIQLHPGEKSEAVFSFTNAGDEVWPADPKPPRPSPELRQAGPVYLGPTNPGGQISLFTTPGWVSGRFAATSDTGDVMPGQIARFVVPLTGPRTFQTQTETLRLWKVFPAPHLPIAFGPSVSLVVSTVPWDIAAPLPTAPPAGWMEKTLPNGSRIFWRTASAPAALKPGEAPSDPVVWTPPLPLAGNWDVYVRAVPGTRKSAPSVFGLPNPKGGEITMVWNNQPAKTDENGWHRLGRFAFDIPPPSGPGVRPGAPTPPAPPLMGTLRLLPGSSQSGVLVAGEVRFVGPFP